MRWGRLQDSKARGREKRVEGEVEVIVTVIRRVK